MTGEAGTTRLLTATSVALWAVAIFLPLAVFVTLAVRPEAISLLAEVVDEGTIDA